MLNCFLTVSVKYHLKTELVNTYHTKRTKRQVMKSPALAVSHLPNPCFQLLTDTLPAQCSEKISLPHCNVQKLETKMAFLPFHQGSGSFLSK